MPRCFIFVSPHVGEAQRTGITIVKVSTGFSTLISTRHKAPVRSQQRLPGGLNITSARPGWAVFEFSCCFIKANPALIAGVIFVIAFIFGRECDFVWMTAFATFVHFNSGKCSDINTKHISRVTGLEVEVGVPGGVRKVGFVFVMIGHIFTVTLTLPVIDAAG
ncbi:hypothetical protein D3C81_1362990 [compost metagenome]